MKVLRYKDLKPEKGIDWTRQHINRLVEAGKFPKPMWLGPNSKAWDDEVIDAWLNARAEAGE